ncbi:uncharacterized protein LOC125178501, partial [Hyalella azteca]|uniref:Uncharacterized protein LOC125178501 n=1 Tax=Hyalella azteca TaxID=294128 RepID=A0A979FNU9_HYAAZ
YDDIKAELEKSPQNYNENSNQSSMSDDKTATTLSTSQVNAACGDSDLRNLGSNSKTSSYNVDCGNNGEHEKLTYQKERVEDWTRDDGRMGGTENLASDPFGCHFVTNTCSSYFEERSLLAAQDRQAAAEMGIVVKAETDMINQTTTPKTESNVREQMGNPATPHDVTFFSEYSDNIQHQMKSQNKITERDSQQLQPPYQDTTMNKRTSMEQSLSSADRNKPSIRVNRCHQRCLGEPMEFQNNRHQQQQHQQRKQQHPQQHQQNAQQQHQQQASNAVCSNPYGNNFGKTESDPMLLSGSVDPNDSSNIFSDINFAKTDNNIPPLTFEDLNPIESISFDIGVTSLNTNILDLENKEENLISGALGLEVSSGYTALDFDAIKTDGETFPDAFGDSGSDDFLKLDIDSNQFSQPSVLIGNIMGRGPRIESKNIKSNLSGDEYGNQPIPNKNVSQDKKLYGTLESLTPANKTYQEQVLNVFAEDETSSSQNASNEGGRDIPRKSCNQGENSKLRNLLEKDLKEPTKENLKDSSNKKDLCNKKSRIDHRENHAAQHSESVKHHQAESSSCRQQLSDVQETINWFPNKQNQQMQPQQNQQQHQQDHQPTHQNLHQQQQRHHQQQNPQHQQQTNQQLKTQQQQQSQIVQFQDQHHDSGLDNPGQYTVKSNSSRHERHEKLLLEDEYPIVKEENDSSQVTSDNNQRECTRHNNPVTGFHLTSSQQQHQEVILNSKQLTKFDSKRGDKQTTIHEGNEMPDLRSHELQEWSNKRTGAGNFVQCNPQTLVHEEQCWSDAYQGKKPTKTELGWTPKLAETTAPYTNKSGKQSQLQSFREHITVARNSRENSYQQRQQEHIQARFTYQVHEDRKFEPQITLQESQRRAEQKGIGDLIVENHLDSNTSIHRQVGSDQRLNYTLSHYIPGVYSFPETCAVPQEATLCSPYNVMHMRPTVLGGAPFISNEVPQTLSREYYTACIPDRAIGTGLQIHSQKRTIYSQPIAPLQGSNSESTMIANYGGDEQDSRQNGMDKCTTNPVDQPDHFQVDGRSVTQLPNTYLDKNMNQFSLNKAVATNQDKKGYYASLTWQSSNQNVAQQLGKNSNVVDLYTQAQFLVNQRPSQKMNATMSRKNNVQADANQTYPSEAQGVGHQMNDQSHNFSQMSIHSRNDSKHHKRSKEKGISSTSDFFQGLTNPIENVQQEKFSNNLRNFNELTQRQNQDGYRQSNTDNYYHSKGSKREHREQEKNMSERLHSGTEMTLQSHSHTSNSSVANASDKTKSSDKSKHSQQGFSKLQQLDSILSSSSRHVTSSTSDSKCSSLEFSLETEFVGGSNQQTDSQADTQSRPNHRDYGDRPKTSTNLDTKTDQKHDLSELFGEEEYALPKHLPRLWVSNRQRHQADAHRKHRTNKQKKRTKDDKESFSGHHSNNLQQENSPNKERPPCEDGQERQNRTEGNEFCKRLETSKSFRFKNSRENNMSAGVSCSDYSKKDECEKAVQGSFSLSTSVKFPDALSSDDQINNGSQCGQAGRSTETGGTQCHLGGGNVESLRPKQQICEKKMSTESKNQSLNGNELHPPKSSDITVQQDGVGRITYSQDEPEMKDVTICAGSQNFSTINFEEYEMMQKCNTFSPSKETPGRTELQRKSPTAFSTATFEIQPSFTRKAGGVVQNSETSPCELETFVKCGDTLDSFLRHRNRVEENQQNSYQCNYQPGTDSTLNDMQKARNHQVPNVDQKPVLCLAQGQMGGAINASCFRRATIGNSSLRFDCVVKASSQESIPENVNAKVSQKYRMPLGGLQDRLSASLPEIPISTQTGLPIARIFCVAERANENLNPVSKNLTQQTFYTTHEQATATQNSNKLPENSYGCFISPTERKPIGTAFFHMPSSPAITPSPMSPMIYGAPSPMVQSPTSPMVYPLASSAYAYSPVSPKTSSMRSLPSPMVQSPLPYVQIITAVSGTTQPMSPMAHNSASHPKACACGYCKATCSPSRSSSVGQSIKSSYTRRLNSNQAVGVSTPVTDYEHQNNFQRRVGSYFHTAKLNRGDDPTLQVDTGGGGAFGIQRNSITSNDQNRSPSFGPGINMPSREIREVVMSRSSSFPSPKRLQHISAMASEVALDSTPSVNANLNPVGQNTIIKSAVVGKHR